MEFSGLSDQQWDLIKNHFVAPEKRGRGKPHAPWRTVVNTIYWVVEAKGKWCASPEGEVWASKSAAHRWYVKWKADGFWKDCIIKALEQSNQNACRVSLHADQTSPQVLQEHTEPADYSYTP